ncbi:conserved hypothetical protein [Leishmania infantum JPCM5]|uniref:Uncharacterized protein n=2 Tax=Leishmania infantum TaxID=5671 RepID=A4I434_LEIIN|nr:conserved hypothetical protein [Leishmania infantum JPCM5]CAC9506036.1 hypothetical_protein_-_conserved [Leishmania infantum]CAM69542.1 conserved hypothetical protein [Leishmania infantum JPCM5]SUZ43494.1 hypothetical_protein_-_conserved [Leishmania infantum]|eukprot:XP_001470346.1 conserved hypothetical protein [Leishmania infantum JPCM5]
MGYGVRLSILPLRGGCRRWFSGCGTGSILGTATMAGSLLKTLQEDLRDETELRTKGIGETLQNYVHRAELSHMESPEADEAFSKSLDAKVDDLFARIPLPQDPMKVALALTDEEAKEEAAAELVKEAVREMYWRKLDAKQAEELRLKRAQEKLQKQGAIQYFEERREERLREHTNRRFAAQPLAVEPQSPVGKGVTASPLQNPDSTLSAEELCEELATLKANVSRLEELLRYKT